MLREAHFQFTFSLPNILYAAPFTCNAVDKVRAGAVHIISAHVGSSGGRTEYSPFRVELRAVPT